MVDFEERATDLNDRPVQEGRYVLYWMQQSQRVSYNHALEYAIENANDLNVPLLVCFGLTAAYPDANERHYHFMIQGLTDVKRGLAERGISFVMRVGKPNDVAVDLSKDARLVVCDRGYLSHLRAWRQDVARRARCLVVEIESDLTVPVEVTSGKQEYAARTIRPKVHKNLPRFLAPVEPVTPNRVLDDPPAGDDPEELDELIQRLSPKKDPGPVVQFFSGGEREAHRRLRRFIDERLRAYEENRSEPGLDVSSALSPYLHFGNISELEIALEVGALDFAAGLEEGKGQMKLKPGSVGIRTDSDELASSRDAFLEELLVRRSLAYNYVWYASSYDSYGGLPDWARATLSEHKDDERQHLYSLEQLEAADTHDEFWNAAMREMRVTGYMHNYMRMYWGKKILEWTKDPEQAHERALTMNNTYFLDGRDANSYANVSWLFGLHDRPWTEREIFGKVRYMNASGLKRKFDMNSYLYKVEQLERQAQ